MEVLTGDTLAEALLFCSQQENVSVCVVLDNMRNTKELVETLWREIELGNLPGWVMQRGFDVASFSNTYSILTRRNHPLCISLPHMTRKISRGAHLTASYT